MEGYMEIDDDILFDEEHGAERAYRNKSLALYLITIGLARLRHSRRQARRREIKKDLLPEITETKDRSGKPFFNMSEAGKRKMRSAAEDWLGSTGWYVSNFHKDLMDCTRDEILQEIEFETRTRDGHNENIKWYGALVQPMKDGNQTIGDFWLTRKRRPQPPGAHVTA